MGKRKDRIMKLLQNLKKDKKGFTLVEMIVVIVIIGILLAILVPGMFKYIDKAKDKQILVNARTAQLNLETAVRELYGKNSVTLPNVVAAVNAFTYGDANDAMKKITADGATVAILPIPVTGATVTDIEMDTEGKIIKMIYTEGKKQVTFDGKGWGDVTPIS